MKIFQPNRMIWSYRKRGNVARTHKNRVATTKALPNSQNQFQNQAESTIHCGVAIPIAENEMGASQPPRNISAASVDTRMMLAYSARKNMANDMPEYSTMWPATISDSPSTTSKG